MAHEQLPYLYYEELVEVFDADLNIKTDGNFANVMRMYYKNYKEKYSDSWKYNRSTEAQICTKYKILNSMRSLGLNQEPILPYKWKSCEATKEKR